MVTSSQRALHRAAAVWRGRDVQPGKGTSLSIVFSAAPEKMDYIREFPGEEGRRRAVRL